MHLDRLILLSLYRLAVRSKLKLNPLYLPESDQR